MVNTLAKRYKENPLNSHGSKDGCFLGLKGLELLRVVLLVNNNLVDVLVKPGSEMVSKPCDRGLYPAVLNLPGVVLPSSKLTPSEPLRESSETRRSQVAQRTVRCASAEGAKRAVNVKRTGIHDALFAKVGLSNIITKPDRQVVLKLRSHSKALSSRSLKGW